MRRKEGRKEERRETWEVVQYGGPISKARHALAHGARAHSRTTGQTPFMSSDLGMVLETLERESVISVPEFSSQVSK